MANPFIEKEIKNIFETGDHSPAKKAALATAWICAHYKTVNIKIFDVSSSSSLSDFYVLCSSENTTQARSLTDELIPQLKKHNFAPISTEGMQDGEWILLDLGDVMLHVFQEGSRDIYALDELWMSYPQVQIPESFFTGSGIEVERQEPSYVAPEAQDDKDYF